MVQEIPVWSVKSWPAVRTSIRDLYRAAPRFRALGCQTQSKTPAGRLSGQVLWGARVSGKQIGIAWDWAEVRRRVVVIADPMQIITNLVLLDDSGNALTYQSSLLQVHNVIHQLEWQFRVLPVEQSMTEMRMAA